MQDMKETEAGGVEAGAVGLRGGGASGVICQLLEGVDDLPEGWWGDGIVAAHWFCLGEYTGTKLNLLEALEESRALSAEGKSSTKAPAKCRFVLLSSGGPLLSGSFYLSLHALRNYLMMSSIGSKRPADGDAGSNAPAPATAKRPKKSDEVPEDQQEASWSTVMTPELVGTVALFLDLDLFYTPSCQSRPDLTNLCLAFGRDTSRVVRKMYLAGNEWYLRHLYSTSTAYINREHKRQAGMESWLEYNPDWRNLCAGANSEKNVYRITLEQAVVKELFFDLSGSYWVLEDSFDCFDAQEDVPSGLAFGIGDALLSVGGVDVTGMKEDDFRNLLESDKIIQDGKIVLKYLPASIRLLSDPLMATRHDFLAPFKHLIEAGAVGVNEAFFPTETPNDEKENLIWFTLGPHNGSSTCKCFEYLLSLEGIEVNTSAGTDGQRPIHFCAHSSDVFSFEALRLLVDSRNRTGIDINVQDVDGWSAIHYIISFLDKSNHRAKMSKLKLLLEAGADPNLRSEGMGTPEQFLLGILDSSNNREKKSEIYEMVGMLRRYTLMRAREADEY